MENVLCQHINPSDFIKFCQDDDELVPAQARHRIGLAHAGADAARRLHQEFVAHTVPERIIDFLETVEVNIQQCHGAAGAPRFLDFLSQPVVEHVAVGQAGQLIKVGLLPDQFLRLFPVGDVVNKTIEFILARYLDRGDGQLNGKLVSVAVQAQHLDP